MSWFRTIAAIAAILGVVSIGFGIYGYRSRRSRAPVDGSVGRQGVERYIVILLGPLAVLFVTALFVQVSSPSLSLGVMLVTLGAYVVAPSWGGWLLVVRGKVSPWAAAFCGPVLIFIDMFAFGYVPSLAFGRFSSMTSHAPDKLIFGSQELTFLVVFLVIYLLIFPISLGLAGIGAYIGVRDLRNAPPQQNANVP